MNSALDRDKTQRIAERRTVGFQLQVPNINFYENNNHRLLAHDLRGSS